MTDAARPGDVFRYPYLWRREADAGSEEGRKARPCCVAVATSLRPGETTVFLLAITTQPPKNDRLAIEIPSIEQRRAGLDADRPSWIILDELNIDVVERSYDFADRRRLGAMSRAFTQRVREHLQRARHDRSLRSVDRR
jgi:hypothetical protein